MKSFANRQKPVWRNANPVPQSGHTFIDQRPESRAQRQMIETIRQSPVVNPGIVRQHQPVMPQAVVQQTSSAPLQMVKESEFIKDPKAFMAENVILFNYSAGFRQRYPETCATVAGKIADTNFNSAINAVMVANKSGLKFSLRLQENTADDGESIYFLAPELGELPAESLNALFANGNVPLDNAKELIAMMKEETDKTIQSLIEAQYVPYFSGSPKKYLAAQANLEQAVPDEANGPWADVGSNVINSNVTRFVFTDAMNGCAYAITGVENSETQFVAWHFQSETDNWKAASTFRAVKEIRDWYGVNDYYPGPVEKNLAATNIIWRDSEDCWKMLSQRNVVPLKQQGSTTFKESVVKGLNVKEPMSEQNLAALHQKFIEKAEESVAQGLVDEINQATNRLQIPDQLMEDLLQWVGVGNGTMSKDVIAEFERIAGMHKVLLKNKDDNYVIFEGISDFCGNYKKTYRKNGFLGMSSYVESDVLQFKSVLASMSRNLTDEVKTMLNECKATPVTTLLTVDDASFRASIRQVRAYYDLCASYTPNTYTAAQDLLTKLGTLDTAKSNAVEKKITLEQEMNKIYPPQQLQQPQQPQQQPLQEQQVQPIEEVQS